jgi:hypothetical protein
MGDARPSVAAVVLDTHSPGLEWAEGGGTRDKRSSGVGAPGLITWYGSLGRRAAMQILLALVALPAVALLLALASRLEDGLRTVPVPVGRRDDLDPLDRLVVPGSDPPPSAVSPGR